MSTEIGGKCITLYVSADHRRFRSKLHVWITWRWCSGWRQGQAAVRVGDVKAWPRCPWAVAGPGRANRPDAAGMERAASTIGPGRGARGRWRGLAGLTHQMPPVWRAPEGPVGQAAVPVGGGGAWPGFETTRRAKLGARTARGRAAAHGHTEQPGPTAHHAAPGTRAPPQPMFHVKHLPNHRPRYPVWPGKWHT